MKRLLIISILKSFKIVMGKGINFRILELDKFIHALTQVGVNISIKELLNLHGIYG